MTLAELLETVRRVEIQDQPPGQRHHGGGLSEPLQGAGHGFRGTARLHPGRRRAGHRLERDLPDGAAVRETVPRGARAGRWCWRWMSPAPAPSAPPRRSKREFAAEVAATLAFSAARSSDKVGLLLFTDQVGAVSAAAQRPAPHPAHHPRAAGVPAGPAGHGHPGGAGLSQPRAAPPVDHFPAHRFPAQPGGRSRRRRPGGTSPRKSG